MRIAIRVALAVVSMAAIALGYGFVPMAESERRSAPTLLSAYPIAAGPESTSRPMPPAGLRLCGFILSQIRDVVFVATGRYAA
jgi:hypothetical protein